MAGIRCPTLVIGNGQDFVHPLEYARVLAALIPRAQLVEVTSKTIDRDSYVKEFRAALAAFLDPQEVAQ
jgi:pimeloyl-ACP methyl ester carboxylesterase